MYSVPRRCEHCEKQLWPSELGVCKGCQTRAATTGAPHPRPASAPAHAWTGGFFATGLERASTAR